MRVTHVRIWYFVLHIPKSTDYFGLIALQHPSAYPETIMLATWLAVLLFLCALQALFVVKLADRLTVSDATQDAPAARGREAAETAERYARAA